MSTNGESYTKGFLLGAIVGGAVGAITALLLAPKSGVELRKDIAEKSKDVYDKAQTMINGIESKVSQAAYTSVNEGRAKAQSIIDSAKKQADDLLKNADDVIKDAKFKVSSSKENLANKIDTVKDASKAGVNAFKTEFQKSNSDSETETLGV